MSICGLKTSQNLFPLSQVRTVIVRFWDVPKTVKLVNNTCFKKARDMLGWNEPMNL